MTSVENTLEEARNKLMDYRAVQSVRVGNFSSSIISIDKCLDMIDKELAELEQNK